MKAWLLLLLCAPALAQEPDAGRRLAATCAGCHGIDGRPRGGVMPPLAGLPEARLVALLAAYRRGERAGTVMPQIATGYTDAQLRQVAAYFASLPAAPARP